MLSQEEIRLAGMWPYVKQSSKCKVNTGARGVMVLAGIGHGKVLVWEAIDGRNWNGDVAAEMYTGPIRTALAKSCPRKRKWRSSWAGQRGAYCSEAEI